MKRLTIGIAIAGIVASASADAVKVGAILQTTSGVRREHGGSNNLAYRGDLLVAGDKLAIPEGGHVRVALYNATATAYWLEGPGKAIITSTAVHAVSGRMTIAVFKHQYVLSAARRLQLRGAWTIVKGVGHLLLKSPTKGCREAPDHLEFAVVDSGGIADLPKSGTYYFVIKRKGEEKATFQLDGKLESANVFSVPAGALSPMQHYVWLAQIDSEDGPLTGTGELLIWDRESLELLAGAEREALASSRDTDMLDLALAYESAGLFIDELRVYRLAKQRFPNSRLVNDDMKAWLQTREGAVANAGSAK